MGCRPRDSGTANSAHKRRARTESVDGRTKESLATRRVKACLQGADNAKEIRRAKTTSANNIDDLIRGGEGGIRTHGTVTRTTVFEFYDSRADLCLPILAAGIRQKEARPTGVRTGLLLFT